MFRHAGQNENQVTVEIMLQKLNINISLSDCEIIIVLKRSDRKRQGQPVPLINKVAVFNSPLKLPIIMYFDPQTQCFQKKKVVIQYHLKAKIIVLVKYEKKIRLIGTISLDLANQLNQVLPPKHEKYKLTQCPDEEATLEFNITFLQDISQSIHQYKLVREKFQKEQIDKQIDTILTSENEKLRQQVQQFQPQVIELQKERTNHLNIIQDLQAQLTLANNQTEMVTLKLKQYKIDFAEDTQQTNFSSQLQLQNQQLVQQVNKLQRQLQIQSTKQQADVKKLQEQNAQLLTQIYTLPVQPKQAPIL